MFRFKDVRERVDKHPFEPFRVCLTDGRTYDITHPELCLPGRTTVYVAVPDPKLKRAIMRVDQCALAHIVRLEPLDGNNRRTPRKRRPT
jgi:hypothetical protein